MIEVEKRSFITKEKYEDIIVKLKKDNVDMEETNQITYYLKGDTDFRIMFPNDFTKMWLKKGNLHDDAREEMEVKVDNQYKEDLIKMLSALNYEVEIKWFRKRIEATYNSYYLTLDYSIGYGYIIEIEKLVEDEKEIDDVKQELESTLKALGVEITPKEEFNIKYQDYKLNWNSYTKEVNEAVFLNS